MIFAFSTSSPVASVAVFSDAGTLLFSGEEPANMRASEACLRLLERSGFSVGEGSLFLADVGPGSFTGTRVGVMLAKTFAFSAGVKCAGMDAFMLISCTKRVVLPSKRGEWFLKEPGNGVIRTDSPPADAVGYGSSFEPVEYPHAKNFESLLQNVIVVDPTELEVGYLIEPSISTPKKSMGVSR